MSRTITEPGFYYDISAEDYHADCCPSPSLSSGCLRKIVEKSIEHAALEHPKIGKQPRKVTKAMGLGLAVHAMMASEPLNTYPASDIAAATPIAGAFQLKAPVGITNNPFASHGRSEVTAVWKEGDVWCRARFDRLLIDPTGYADFWDWKTISDVSVRAIERAIVKYAYHIQVAFYLRGLLALLPGHRGRVGHCLCFGETAPPNQVRRVSLSQTFLRLGAARVDEGLAIWKRACATGDFSAPPHPSLEVEAPAYLDDDDEISASDAT